MRIFHDWEFLELGPSEPIRPLSVGLVREDGAELYIVIKDTDALRLAYEKHPWLVENVLPYLPVENGGCFSWPHYDENHPDAQHVKDKALAAAMVKNFVLGEGPYPYSSDSPGADTNAELWGWYSSYDHVCLSQLFGAMVNLPEGFPKYTRDLKQECDRLAITDLPKMPGAHEHHALSDAREIAWRSAHLGEWFSPDPATGRVLASEGRVLLETSKSAGNSA